MRIKILDFISLWNIRCSGCCYLRRTHRLHPVLAALRGLFLHQWRARPQKYQIHLEDGSLKGKPLWNVIKLYKTWCKGGGGNLYQDSKQIKLLIWKYCVEKWHNSVRNSQEAIIKEFVSFAGTWSVDAKCLYERLVCIKRKGSGFYVENELQALSI